MGEEFQVSADPTIYFYVDKQTEEVGGIYMFSIFGIMAREKGKDWRVGSREESALQDFINSRDKYSIYAFDWDTDVLLAKDSDPEDDEEWNPQIIQAWGRGEDLTLEDIKSFTRMVNPGESINPSQVEEL
jgi:hypothetical protein